MQLWLDTIDLTHIKQASENGLLTGVTTNPNILSQADTLPETKLQQILDIQSGHVAAQVTADDLAGMLTQARRLAALDKRMIIKIPVTVTGLKAMTILTQENIPTLATTVFEISQVYLAALAGARYVAPYLGRMAEYRGSYVAELQTMLHMIKTYQLSIQVMAASIHNKEQIMNCLELGVHAITVPPDAYSLLIHENSWTATSLKQFDSAWAAGSHTQRSKLFTEL